MSGVTADMIEVGHIDLGMIRAASIVGTFYDPETDRFVFVSRFDDGTLAIDPVRTAGPLYAPVLTLPEPPPISSRRERTLFAVILAAAVAFCFAIAGASWGAGRVTADSVVMAIIGFVVLVTFLHNAIEMGRRSNR